MSKSCPVCRTPAVLTDLFSSKYWRCPKCNDDIEHVETVPVKLNPAMQAIADAMSKAQDAIDIALHGRFPIAGSVPNPHGSHIVGASNFPVQQAGIKKAMDGVTMTHMAGFKIGDKTRGRVSGNARRPIAALYMAGTGPYPGNRDYAVFEGGGYDYLEHLEHELTVSYP